MEHKDIAEQSEACLSFKNRILTSLWEDVRPLLLEVLKLSRHPTVEDAVLELSRSELLFLSLLQALRMRNILMSVRLLQEVDDWQVLPRLSFYLGHKLHVEFNCPKDFFSKAAEFAHFLQKMELFTVPEKVILFLDHLAECMRKEIEARSSRKQAVARQDLHEFVDIGKTSCSSGQMSVRLLQEVVEWQAVARQDPHEGLNVGTASRSSGQARRRGQRRRVKSATKRSQQAVRDAALSSSSITTSSASPRLIAVGDAALSSTNKTTSSASPQLIKERSREEVEDATETLWPAILRNDIAAVRSAIERGASLERMYGGLTPLHWAAYYGQVEMVDELLSAGAPLEAVDKDGDRPLHIAARYACDRAVARLVEAGADINASGSGDRTPLQRALRWNNTSTANLLLSLGALQ